MAIEKLQLTPHEAVEIVSVDDHRLEAIATYAPGGERPPVHLHPDQDEHFEVLAGTLRVECDGAVHEYGEGEGFDIPRGAAHRMSNAGAVRTRVTWTTSPAGRTLEWFRALDATQRRVDGKKALRLLAFARLLLEYRDVFRLSASNFTPWRSSHG